jgi:hypothetical protein
MRPQGEVRHSQLITTYGPGAMVDLPDCSVVIGGLNLWMYGPDHPPEEIDEPRLIAKLRQSLNVGSLRLRKPPIHDVGPGGQSRPGGIRSPEFPNWFVAQVDQTKEFDGKTYRSRPLVEGARLDKRKYVDADRKAHRVVPVRFVQTCPNGHLSDIDWREFVHRGKTTCRATLWLDEAGAGNDFTEIFCAVLTLPAWKSGIAVSSLKPSKNSMATRKSGQRLVSARGIGPGWALSARKPAITARARGVATSIAYWCVPPAMPTSLS